MAHRGAIVAHRLTAALAAAAVLLGGAVGCGGASGDDARSSTGPSGSGAAGSAGSAPAGDPARLPLAFLGPGDDRWSLVGATDDVLVGLGGPLADEERAGQAFDLATGAVTDIPAPPFDDERPVTIDEVVFGAGHVIAAGFVYDRGFTEEDIPPDTGFTPPTELVTYRLDPVAGEWTRLALPEGEEAADRTTLFELHPAGPDGAAGSFGHGSHVAVLRGDDDGWRSVSRDTTPWASGSFCATADDWWQLDEVDPDTAELSAISLADGAVRAVEAPGRVTDDRWDVRSLGCTADGVVLGVSSNRDEPAAVFVGTGDGAWTEVADPFGAPQVMVAVDGSSAGPSIVVDPGMTADGIGEEPVAHPVLIDTAGGSTPLDPSRSVVGDLPWLPRHLLRGATGEVLVVDAPVSDATATLRTLPAP